MRTDLSSFNTAAQLQKLVCETLLSSAELNALSVEFIPENRQDIDYQIKKNLMQQGLVGICMTPTMNYIGHDGASISYDVKGLTLQIVENVPVNRASNKVSCVTGLDVANYVASYLGGPQAAPGFGIFCPTGIEQGEDNGLIVTKCTFDCTIDGGYGGEFQPISGYHVFNPYVTRDDISSLIQLSIDFNAMSAMVSACISSSMNKADLSTVLSVRDELVEGIEYVHDEVQDVSSHQRYYLPLSGGTLKSGPDVVQTGGVNLSPSRIQISDGMAGGSSITVNSSKVQLGQVNGPNYPVQEIANGIYSSFGFVKVNSTGLDVALSAVQERAISSASGHLSVLSDYYTKNETSSAQQIQIGLNGKADLSFIESAICERATTTLSVMSDGACVGTVTAKIIKTNYTEQMPGVGFSAGDPPVDIQAAGVITDVHVINQTAFYNEVGWIQQERLIGTVVPFTGTNYSYIEDIPLFNLQGSRGTLYFAFKDNYKSTGLSTSGTFLIESSKLTVVESSALKASSSWKQVFQNYYTKDQTSSYYQLTQKFNKIYEKTQTSSAVELSDMFRYYLPLSGGTIKLDPSSTASGGMELSPGQIKFTTGQQGSPSRKIDVYGIHTTTALGPSYPSQRIQFGDYRPFNWIDVNEYGLGQALSVVEQRAIAGSTGHLSVLSDYYTKNETSSDAQLSVAFNDKADAEILSAYTCDKVHTFIQGYAPPTLIASLSVHYVFAKVKSATSCLNEQWRIGGYVTDAYVVNLSAFEEIAGFSLTKDDLVGRVLPYDNLNSNYLYRYHKILPFITLAHWTQAPSQNQFYLTFPSQEVTDIEYQWNVENSLSSRKLTARDSAILAASDAICQNYLAMRNFSYEKNQTSSAVELSVAFENNKGVQEVSASVDVLKTELYGADKDMSMVATLKLDRLQEQLNAYSAHLSIEPLSGQPKLSAMAQRTAYIYEIYGIPCQQLSSMSALYESVHDIGISTDLSTTFMLSFKQSFTDLVKDYAVTENAVHQLSVYSVNTREMIPTCMSELSNDIGYAKWSGVQSYTYPKAQLSTATQLSIAFQNIQLSDVYKKNETSSAAEISTALGNIGAVDEISAGMMYISSEVSCKVDSLSATQIARKEVADFQAQLSTIAPLSADCTMQELLGAVNTIIAALKAQIIHS